MASQNSNTKALGADIRALSNALVKDADDYGEQWSPSDVGDANREHLHLQSGALFKRGDPVAGGAEARSRYEDQLESAEHLIRGVAARLLAERLHNLYRFATLAFGPERAVKSLASLDTHKQTAIAALTRCLDDPRLNEPKRQFKQAAEQVPEEIELFTFISSEYAESYWDGMERIAGEYISNLRAYLASLNKYGEYLRHRAMTRRYVFLNSKRRRLSERIEAIIEELNGERLHRGKEGLRRELESQGASGKKRLSDTFVGRFLGRKPEKSPEPQTDQEKNKLEETFDAITKTKKELQANRNRLREQVMAIDTEFKDAGIDRTEISLEAYEPDAGILQRKQALRSAERLSRTCLPLQRLVAAAGSEASNMAHIRTLKQFEKLTTSLAPSRTLLSAIEVTDRLLRIYAMDPIRFLGVCLLHTPVRKVELFEAKRKRAQSLDEWLGECESNARRTDTTLEYFLTEVAHAAPERFGQAAADECRLLLGSREVAQEIARNDARHEGSADRRLSRDHRQHERRQGERRTNVIAVDFDRRRGNERRQTERRVASRRG